jgi:hypothetical protein
MNTMEKVETNTARSSWNRKLQMKMLSSKVVT